jgi:hypothetical protein
MVILEWDTRTVCSAGAREVAGVFMTHLLKKWLPTWPMRRPRDPWRLQPGVEVVPATHGFVPPGAGTLLREAEIALG